eukprot:778863-Rhodomonas_salina.3
MKMPRGWSMCNRSNALIDPAVAPIFSFKVSALSCLLHFLLFSSFCIAKLLPGSSSFLSWPVLLHTGAALRPLSDDARPQIHAKHLPRRTSCPGDVWRCSRSVEWKRSSSAD